MPTHKSAEKRVRQNEKRRIRNKTVKTRVKSSVRAIREALEASANGNTPDDINETLKTATADLARAVTKGVIPKRRASRKISRLTRAVNTATKA